MTEQMQRRVVAPAVTFGGDVVCERRALISLGKKRPCSRFYSPLAGSASPRPRRRAKLNSCPSGSRRWK